MDLATNRNDTYEIPAAALVRVCGELYFEKHWPLKTIAAVDDRAACGSFKIFYVFGVPGENRFVAPFIAVDDEFPSLTSLIFEAAIYERKIKTLFGLHPVSHPDARSLILHENWPDGVYPLRKGFDWRTRPPEAHTPFHFREILGEGIYEVPVGPVHAGIIEPGHFRFSLAGEEILMLEPRLGYSHKGSEKLFEVLPLHGKLRLAERISGDTSFSHSLAFCQALENLSGIRVSARSAYLRVIFSELERLANHFGDLGAIMTDTGFNFGGAQCARLREIVMQANERLTGSRFLRGVNAVGETVLRGPETELEALRAQLAAIAVDFAEIIGIAEGSSSLLNRLKETGILEYQVAKDHGVVGVPARALGICADARVDYPYAAYGDFTIDVATATGGDVYARFCVRVKEVSSSLAILEQALCHPELVEGPRSCHPELVEGLRSAPSFDPNACTVSIVEGWRGDIVYFVRTDSEGNIDRVDVRDPSFLNWTALGYAGVGNMLPDFPLINKSFNLSYSGNDL